MRAIFDCRPADAVEQRLHWTCLPTGVMFSWLRLAHDEVIRGSGDDLANWFYQLKECPDLVSRRAFGRAISPDEARSLGVTCVSPSRVCLRVLGMGSLSAPDIAQAVHTHMLREARCLLSPQVLLFNDRPG